MEKLSRRNALKLAAAVAVNAALTACEETPTVTPTPTRVRKPTQASTQTPIQKSPYPAPVEVNTPTLPPEKTKTPAAREVQILNESGQEQINIPQETLDFIKTQITESGLAQIVKKVAIKTLNDPVFDQTQDTGYPRLITIGGLNRPTALAVGFDHPENGITLYLANTNIEKATAAHELGHAGDPRLNKAINFDTKDFDNGYFANHYLKYLDSILSDEPTLEPYLFSYEKQIVMGISANLGEKSWKKFADFLPNPPDGIKDKKPFISDDKLQEITASLPEGSIQRKALEWRINELSRLKANGKKPLDNGFSYETWGKFLQQLCFRNPKAIENVDPTLFNEVMKVSTNTFWIARYEVWADLWAERVLNPENAKKLYPLGVLTQEQVIEFLKSK